MRVLPLLLLLPACGPADDGDFDWADGAEEPPGAEGDDVEEPEEAGTNPCAEEQRGAFLNVEEVAVGAGTPWWSCPVDLQWDAPQCACVDGYLGLAAAAADYREGVSAEELEAELRAVDPELDGSPAPDVELWTGTMDPVELADRLLEATGTCFLHEGIDERPLVVEVAGDQVDASGLRVRKLIFEDPFIGRFAGTLMTPPGVGPFPAVVAMHGHGDDAGVFLDRYHGDWFPQDGIAILALTLRGMCVDENEDLAARSLLLAGTSVLGVRGYEAALARKYLAWLPEVDPERIGLIGHSTGSISGNVTIRTVPGFAAYVSDLQDSYYAYVDRPLFADVMSPRTFPYWPLINDFDTSEVPIHEAGYGYGTINEDDPQQPNELEEILRFFKDKMVPVQGG